MGKVSTALNKVSGIEPKREEFAPSSVNDELAQSIETPQEAIEEKRNEKSYAPTPLQTVSERWDERLVIATENFSSVAESFRKLRTLIQHPENGKHIRSILVVSATAQEGKTFVCANLGVALAQGFNNKALVIDCDLRRPSLHNLFGLGNNEGLVDYISGSMDLPELIRKTQLSGLSILPSGPPPENPSELISSAKTIELIQEAMSRYEDRLVILDSPPMLAAAETIVLSQLVDKVVLVVRWGKAAREEIKKVVDQIGREKIIGTVFNAFELNIIDKKVQGVGYHNYYSESYY